ncbi:MAG: translin family protein [Thermoplasmata archaeon]
MERLYSIIEDIDEYISRKDKVRESALKQSRIVVRLSGELINAIHRKEKTGRIWKQLKKEGKKLKKTISDFPELCYTGAVEAAFMELSEAFVFSAVLSGEEPPGPSELEVTEESYVLGLADVIGELRRELLQELKDGNIDTANNLLEKMEKLYEIIMKFDYPSGLLPIRQKQDNARAILERTRSDLAVACRGKALEERIKELIDKL